MSNFFLTYTGRQFDPLNFHPDMVSLTDIAHHLSNICRYGGASRRFYSVAEHCVHLSDYIYAAFDDRQFAGAALLHDASEAYVGDMVRPLKSQIPEFEAVELPIIETIFGLFSLDMDFMSKVRPFDLAICIDEMDQLMARVDPSLEDRAPLHIKMQCWEPEVAEFQFLRRATHLFDVRYMTVSQ